MALLVGRCVHGMNGRVTRSAIVVSLVVLLDQIALGPTPALAQVARVEMHAFASATLTDQQFLTGERQGTPVILAGELRLPRPGTERLPAVIVVHSSAGVLGRIDAWARWLNDLGVATFVLDAFSGRGLVNISADQGKLGRLNMIADSYRALELLSRHARIDPQRIAIMGFSRGGTAALYASVKRFQHMHLAQGLGFAAYIAFYPSCNVTYIDGDDVADKPVRIFHGALDDFDPPAPCRPYIARLQKAGRDVQHTEYPGAHHVFDSPAIKVPIQFPQSQTVRRCRLEETEGGRIVNSATKQTFTYEDPCVERGPTLGYNENAAREAEKAVKAFLTATFRLQ
jgi:dienelactone hydrolase